VLARTIVVQLIPADAMRRIDAAIVYYFAIAT